VAAFGGHVTATERDRSSPELPNDRGAALDRWRRVSPESLSRTGRRHPPRDSHQHAQNVEVQWNEVSSEAPLGLFIVLDSMHLASPQDSKRGEVDLSDFYLESEWRCRMSRVGDSGRRRFAAVLAGSLGLAAVGAIMRCPSRGGTPPARKDSDEQGHCAAVL
jgi:hypothetical protein